MNIESHMNWVKNLDSIIDGVVFDGNDRTKISVSLLHLSIEHQKGISYCVHNAAYSSAFALYRPQFESFVRGTWFNRCATDTQISSFIKGSEPPKINELISAIEKHDDYAHGVLKEQKNLIWGVLNDFTHGGSIQARLRITSNEIKPNYEPETIQWLLDKSFDLSFIAAIEIGLISKNNELIHSLKNQYSLVRNELP